MIAEALLMKGLFMESVMWKAIRTLGLLTLGSEEFSSIENVLKRQQTKGHKMFA